MKYVYELKTGQLQDNGFIFYQSSYFFTSLKTAKLYSLQIVNINKGFDAKEQNIKTDLWEKEVYCLLYKINSDEQSANNPKPNKVVTLSHTILKQRITN